VVAILPGEVVLASGNPGKLKELAELLDPLGLHLRPQSEWGFAEAEEDACTFVENALKKARHAAGHTGLPAIGDDSGLVVPALGGAPGIFSARYAGTPSDARANNLKLLTVMQDLSGDARDAYFHCAMVLVRVPEDPVPLIASASWHGRIAGAPRGAGGFGYDPLFELPDRGCTAAELPSELKHRLSHRGQAVRELLRLLGAAHDHPG